MNREQARNYLKSSGMSEEQIAEIESAFTCEDAISRQAAISIIQNWLDFDTGYSWGEKNVMLCAIDELKGLPSVSTEKTGRWIDDEFGSKCSCCGIHTHLDKFDRPMKFKHCSMCGAKMGVEE